MKGKSESRNCKSEGGIVKKVRCTLVFVVPVTGSISFGKYRLK